LYLIALEKYTVQLDSFYTKYSANKERYATIYLEQTDLINPLPETIGNRNIVQLKMWDLKGIYKENDGSLIHTKIFPLKINKGFIEITLTPYHAKMRKKGKLDFAISDWTTVYFEYDFELKKWIYSRTENDGI